MHVAHFDLNGENINVFCTASFTLLDTNEQPLRTFIQNSRVFPHDLWFRIWSQISKPWKLGLKEIIFFLNQEPIKVPFNTQKKDLTTLCPERVTPSFHVRWLALCITSVTISSSCFRASPEIHPPFSSNINQIGLFLHIWPPQKNSHFVSPIWHVNMMMSIFLHQEPCYVALWMSIFGHGSLNLIRARKHICSNPIWDT